MEILIIRDIASQPKEVLVDYILYVDGKAEIDEVPISFYDWAMMEIDSGSPISQKIHCTTD